MAWTKKTIDTWYPYPQQASPEFVAEMDAWLTKAIADGLTDVMRSPHFVGKTFTRLWRDQEAAEAWETFITALADEYGYFIESVEIVDNV